MNNKEKLYLVKAAKKAWQDFKPKGVQGMGLYDLHKQLNSQPKRDTFARSKLPKDMFGTGEGFKPKPELPNKPLPFQQPMRDSRYQLPAYSQPTAADPLTRLRNAKPDVVTNASYESVDGGPYIGRRGHTYLEKSDPSKLK
jgi:hypothetical protein